MHKHLIPLIDEQFGNKCNWAALNGDIFMTDKKILFRLPNTEPTPLLLNKPGDKQIPLSGLERVWNGAIRQPFSIHLRSLVGSCVAEPCPVCAGKKRLFLCPACWGSGEDEFAGEVLPEVPLCPKCKGRGHGEDLSTIDSECYRCDGYGKKQTIFTIKFQPLVAEKDLIANFDLRLLEIVLAICPDAMQHSITRNKASYFSDGHIDGLIMPMVV